MRSPRKRCLSEVAVKFDFPEEFRKIVRLWISYLLSIYQMSDDRTNGFLVEIGVL